MNGISCNANYNDCKIKRNNVLIRKLRNQLPISFISSKNKENLFLIKNISAKYFCFSAHLKSAMYSIHFKIMHCKIIIEPMLILKHGQLNKCTLLL